MAAAEKNDALPSGPPETCAVGDSGARPEARPFADLLARGTGTLVFPLTFSRAEVGSFTAASGDHNPLTTSEPAARKTPYGERPVSGVLAVLRVLGEIAPTSGFRLASLKVRFNRPLFVGRDYEVQGKVSPEGAVEARITSASGTSYAKLTGRLAPSSREGALRSSAERARGDGSPPPTQLSSLAEHGVFGSVHADVGPLLWISHVLGTASGGRSACLTSFELTTTEESPAHEGPFSPEVQVEEDPRFDLLQITATSQGLTLSVQAVCLPPPVSLRWEEAPDVGSALELHGKSVVVTGASRGFGLAVAMTACRSGLSTHGLVREISGDLLSVAAAAAADQRPLTFHAVDLAATDCGARLSSVLRSATPTLDFLILSASGPIQEIPLLDQPEGYLAAFVRSSLDLVMGPLRAAVPLLRPQATVVLVSSVFVQDPPRNLAHYVAAKVAAESVLRSFAAELPGCRFVVARAPKMLTDQTNAGPRGAPLPSSFDVASRLWQRLLGLSWDGTGNFRLLDDL